MAGVARAGNVAGTQIQSFANLSNAGGFEFQGSPDDYVNYSSTGTSKWIPAVWSGTIK